MKYYLYKNADGFISGFIKSEKEFNYDGSLPDDFILSLPEGWYMQNGNDLIKDEGREEIVLTGRSKKKRIEEIMKELETTDYVQDDFIDSIMSLNNPVTFITDILALISKITKDYPQIIAKRKELITEMKTLI